MQTEALILWKMCYWLWGREEQAHWLVCNVRDFKCQLPLGRRSGGSQIFYYCCHEWGEWDNCFICGWTVTKRDKDLGLVQGQHRTMAPGYHSLFHLAIDRGYPFSWLLTAPSADCHVHANSFTTVSWKSLHHISYGIAHGCTPHS